MLRLRIILYFTLFFFAGFIGRVQAQTELLGVQHIDALISMYKMQHNINEQTELLLKRAIQLSKQSGYTAGLYRGSGELGRLYIQQEKPQLALLLLKPLLVNSFAEYNIAAKRHYTSISVVNAYMQMKEYDNAMSELERAAVYVQNPEQKLYIYVMAAAIYVSMPDLLQPEGYRKALQYLQQAEELTLAQNNMRQYALVLQNKGHIYLKCKDWAKCEEVVQKGIHITKQNPEYYAPLLVALTTQGQAAYEQKHYDEAIVALTQVIRSPYRNRVEIQYIFGEAYVTLAKTYIQVRQYEQAEKMLVQADKIVGLYPSKLVLQEWYQVKSELSMHQHDYKKGMEYYRKYIGIRDTIAQKDKADIVQYIEVKNRVAQKDKELLQRALFIEQQQQNIDKKNYQLVLILLSALSTITILLVLYSRRRHKQKWLEQKKDMDHLRDIVHTEEMERTRIARELHDGIGGMLTVIDMQFQKAGKEQFQDTTQVSKIRNMLQETSVEVRRAAYNLLPTALEHNNLLDALHTYCMEINHSGALIIDIDAEGDFTHLDTTFSTTLFRIIQELIQNIRKHAQATHAILTLNASGHHIRIEIEDNGKGFDTTKLQAGGMGLKNIKDRVRHLNGTISINAQNTSGTHIVIDIPNVSNN